MPDENSETLVDKLLRHDRVIIEASLELANGSFFQPTGFPDIGACIFVDKDGQRRCLVESEQSLANRLEAVCMQAPGTWRAPFDDKLPVIRVVDGSGHLLATNLTEPHRLSSSYILEGTREGGPGTQSTLQEILREKLGISPDGKRWPLDKRAELSRVVFALDPAALLHGFQFMQWSAVGLRQQRLLHARMEAVLAGDSDVHYGAVKVDAIDPKGHKAKSNIGQSIAHKERLVPESISATFEIDLLGLRERWLVGEKPRAHSNENDNDRNDRADAAKTRAEAENKNREAQKFLLALALWKVRQFLADQPAFDARTGQVERSLRLRSDCALKLIDKSGKQEGLAKPAQGNSPLQYRTQSNGASFDTAVELALDDLVKVEDGIVTTLVAPPEFGSLLRDIVGAENLDMKVKWTAAPKAEEPPPPSASEDADDDNEETDTDE